MGKKEPISLDNTSALRLRSYTIAVTVMWTCVVALSLISSLYQQKQETLEVTRMAARAAYEKDVTYRQWNAQHGGVYVPITEATQPNPYLKSVTGRPIVVTAYAASDTKMEEGLALTLINPAYMTRQVHELTEERQEIRGHITSLDPIRPANAPDAWEREALQAFEEGQNEQSQIQTLDGVKQLRLMRPLITEQACLACHAEQGYEVGDVRGGISVSVPMTSLEAAAQYHNRTTWLGHGLLWIVGSVIVNGGGQALQKSLRTVSESEKRYKSLIQSIQAAIIVHDADGRIIMSNPAAQRLLGIPEENLTGKSPREATGRFLHEHGAPLPDEAHPVNRVLSAEQPVRDLIVGIQSDEQSGIQWLLVNAEPIFEDGGAITQVIVTFMDMTERKREENVTEARLRLASAATKRTSETLMQMALDEIEALTDSEVGFYHTLLEDQETLVLQTWSTNTLAHMCDAEGQGSHYPVSEAGIWVECVHERRPVIHNDYAAHPHKKGMPPGHAPIHRELVLPIMRGDQIVAILGVGNKATDYDQKDIEIISLLGDFSWEIIQRKLTEEALQYREEQYSLALRAANAGSWDWNIEADELLWSEQIEPLFGFEEGEFAGTFEAFLDCVHPNDRQSLLDNVEQALNGDKDYAIEHRIIWPDGNVRWVAETGDVLQNEEGDPIRMLGVVQDITSRKQVEQEVVRQKEMLETTLESLTHPFFVLDADDYSIVMANSASLPEEGVSPSATCYAITHKTEKPCANEEHPCPLEEVKRTRAPTKVEHIHYAPDGSPRYVEVYGYPIFDKDGEVTQMIEYTLDITERIAAQKSLAEKTAALVRSNAELEDFAYIASHDLQEPLRKVQAFGDRLKVKYSDVLEGRGLDYLTRMQSAATRMRQLIDDLLTYSRVTTKAKPFETVDLNRVVDEALADLVVRVKETQGKVDVDLLPTIDADRIQMRRMMQNLIGNALKFHKDSEPPMVNIYAEVPRAEETSPLDNAAADGFCQIFVEDQGIGFDMAYVEQIFAPFQRLHGRSTYEGTGMGLAICRKIAERHGGEIAAHSKPGEGATFIITLPMKQSKEER